MSADDPRGPDTQRLGSPRSRPAEDDAPRLEQEMLTIPPEWVGMKLKSNAELDREASAPTEATGNADLRTSTLPPAVGPRHPRRPISVYMLAAMGLAVGLLLLVFARSGASPPNPPESAPVAPANVGPIAPAARPETPRSQAPTALATQTPAPAPSSASSSASPSPDAKPLAPGSGTSSSAVTMPSSRPSPAPAPLPASQPDHRWEFVDPRSDYR